jgi:hypothetical protein
VRVDRDSFLGSPLPPEEPTAKNPPDGAVIDYDLKSGAQHIKLEILDEKQNLVRSFSSDDVREQKASLRPIAERWLPKPENLETTAGMHRFVWNLAWGDPGGDAAGPLSGDEYRTLRSPRAVPGAYLVRLTIDGKTFSQPLKIVMDPRSSATARDLEEQLRLGLEIFAEAIRSRKVLSTIKSVQKQLTDLEGKLDGHADLKLVVSQLEGEIRKILAGSDDSSAKTEGLEEASTGLGSALAVVESSDRPVPSQAVALYHESAEGLKVRVADWNHVKTNWLPQLNQHLRQNNLTPIVFTESAAKTSQ